MKEETEAARAALRRLVDDGWLDHLPLGEEERERLRHFMDREA